MKLFCTSWICTAERPIEYCKECSHANWIVNHKTTFNPHFGFSSKRYYKHYDQWLDELEKLDVKDVGFE